MHAALKAGLTAAALICAASTYAASLELALPGTNHASVPVRSLLQQRFRTTIRQQFDFSCGSAALATLLTYHYEAPVDERAALEAMYRGADQDKIRREGFSMLDMKRYLASLGYAADGFRVPLTRLAEARVPAIALVEQRGYRHFVVIKGVSEDRVLIGDPALGTRTVNRADFEARQSGILLVIRDRAEVGRRHFNDLSEWRGTGRAPLELAVNREGLESRTLLVPR